MASASSSTSGHGGAKPPVGSVMRHTGRSGAMPGSLTGPMPA